jgi:hypothetical protein
MMVAFTTSAMKPLEKRQSGQDLYHHEMIRPLIGFRFVVVRLRAMCAARRDFDALLDCSFRHVCILSDRRTYALANTGTPE